MAVATLGLGVGVCTAVFSVLDGVVFRPLPYEGSDRIVRVWETYPEWRGRPILQDSWDRIALAWTDYDAWRTGQRTFETVAAYDAVEMVTTGSGSPARLSVGLASVSLFPLLGTRPSEGRLFLSGEDGPGAPQLAIVSSELTVRLWGASNEAIGRTIGLDGIPFVVVGVLPPEMRFAAAGSDPPDLWIPLGSTSTPLSEENHFLSGVGKLRDGVELEMALQETEVLLRRGRSPETLGARIVPLYDVVVGEARPPLLLLMGAAAFLLLMTCANVAALFAGESGSREREVATRTALGGRRGRILRQLLVETLVLCSLAVACGVLIAQGLTTGLVLLAPPELPRLDEVVIDGRVLFFSAGVGVAIALVFGLLRSAALSRVPPLTLLQQGGRHSVRGRGRSHATLVGVQLALATLLLTAATLLGRSLLQVAALEPGFSTDRLLTALIEIPESRYPESFEVTEFFGRLQSRLESEATVSAVGGISTVPFSGRMETTSVRPDGLSPDEPSLEAERRVILPGTLEALGVPLVTGRLGPVSSDVPTVVVSEALARRFWPDGSALDGGIALRDRRYSVVGVVGDLRDRDLREVSEGAYYVPIDVARDGPPRRMHLVVRTVGNAADGEALLRAAVAELDPELPVSEVSTMDGLIGRSLASERYRTIMINVFSAVALLLVAVGIFGVTVRSAVRRRRELAVRAALGATPRDLMVHSLVPTLPAAAMGMAVGLVLSLAGAPLLTRFLDGLPSRDLPSYLLSATLLLSVTLVAAWLPSRKAARSTIVAALAEE